MAAAKLLLIGLAAGTFGAIFGVGGGIVIVPLLLWLHFDQRRASATSLAAILVASAAGSITYALHGDVKPGAAAVVGIPAMVGVVAGASFQQRIPLDLLTYLFALVLAVVGVRLLL